MTEASRENREPTMPLVSVVIPAYNAETYVAEAVDSALAQDYPCKEVIVVDDGSDDRTIDVLGEYGDRIRLIQQTNAGSATARNRGIEAARGEYVAFLDSDDVWLPGKLTAQVAYMEHNPDIGMTYGRWQQWHMAADGKFPALRSDIDLSTVDLADPTDTVPERSGWIYHLLLLDVIVWTSVVMARRSLLTRVGWFDTRYQRGQDFDYWLRASRHTEIHMLDRPMGLYRQHADNSTHACPTRNFQDEIIESALMAWGEAGPDGSRTDRAKLRRHRERLWTGFAS